MTPIEINNCGMTSGQQATQTKSLTFHFSVLFYTRFKMSVLMEFSLTMLLVSGHLDQANTFTYGVSLCNF